MAGVLEPASLCVASRLRNWGTAKEYTFPWNTGTAGGSFGLNIRGGNSLCFCFFFFLKSNYATNALMTVKSVDMYPSRRSP